MNNAVIANQQDQQQQQQQIGHEDPLKNKVFKSLQVISGRFEPLETQVNLLVSMLKQYDNNTVVAVLKRGIDTYDNNYATYPSKPFWRSMISDIRRVQRMSDGTHEEKYKKPDDAEREAADAQARGIVEHFESLTKSHDDKEKPNFYTEKVKRYRQYVADQLVRVEDKTHVLHDQWIFRKQAVQQGLNFHCPEKWLEEREIKTI